MKLLIFVIFVVALMSAVGGAAACSVPPRPFESEFPNYKQVFVGHVVAIHLTEYEKSLRHRIESGSDDGVGTYFGSSALEHEVRVVVSHRLKGTVQDTMTMKLSGCGITLPQPGDEGIFFVNSGGGIIPVYMSERFWFSEWLFKATKYYRSEG